MLIDDTFSGKPTLREVLEKSYGSVCQAVASMTVFPPNAIVDRLTGAVCNAVRISKQHVLSGKKCRDTILLADGRLVMLDENCIPDGIFKFCFKPTSSRAIKRDNAYTQLNHIYRCAGLGPEYFANLANLCITPNFVAKLTDEDSEVKLMLKFRAFQLYGFNPEAIDFSSIPSEFFELKWFEVPLLNQANFDEFRLKFEAKKDKDFAKAKECGINKALR